ncbi:MAG: hypothetical protein QOJ25_1753, partial [Solirubrobacteraceae bacterium]|nr:hypothetical protein [Solirubrobacteraceae bacterium]
MATVLDPIQAVPAAPDREPS